MRFKIAYGSGGGNTELVCQFIAKCLQEAGHQADLLRFKLIQPADLLSDVDCVILASPTYGHGLLEQYTNKFMAKAEQENFDFKQVPCAVVGLGDMMYDSDYFIEAAKILKEFVVKHNGKMTEHPLMIAKSPIPHLDTSVRKWVERVIQAI